MANGALVLYAGYLHMDFHPPRSLTRMRKRCSHADAQGVLRNYIRIVNDCISYYRRLHSALHPTRRRSLSRQPHLLALQPCRQSLELCLELFINSLDIIHLHLPHTALATPFRLIKKKKGTYVLRGPFDAQSGGFILYGLGDHVEVYVVDYLMGPSAVVLHALGRGSADVRRKRTKGVRGGDEGRRWAEGAVPGASSSFPRRRRGRVSS